MPTTYDEPTQVSMELGRRGLHNSFGRGFGHGNGNGNGNGNGIRQEEQATSTHKAWNDLFDEDERDNTQAVD
jgi:hypothetical protein